MVYHRAVAVLPTLRKKSLGTADCCIAFLMNGRTRWERKKEGKNFGHLMRPWSLPCHGGWWDCRKAWHFLFCQKCFFWLLIGQLSLSLQMCCCVIGKLVWRRLDGFGDLSSLGSLGSFVNVTIMMLVWCGSYAVFKNFCQNRFLTFQLVTKANNPRFNTFAF